MAFTAGEGLEQSTRAYLKWVVDMQKRFPEVLFETCSSGGMRMDYETLSHFPIISTSDNISYLRYPEIAGNILSAVLPEQAAVWSYPVDTRIDGVEFEESREWVDKNIFDEQVIMNMINSFLGRMHLASHLELLDEEKLELVKEGVEYFGSFAEDKKIGLPYFPLGFTSFDKELVACGIKTDGKLYLAVWNLSPEAAEAIIPLSEVKATDAHIAYPKKAKTDYSICENGLKISFESGKIARFFELEI
jgi:alpha-galactosidase